MAMAMVVSSRDRIRSASIAATPKWPPPGRRRLRFSFQINDVKDRSALAGPAGNRPAAREAGLYPPRFRLSIDLRHGPGGPERPKTERKNHLRGRRGTPRKSVSDSIEGVEANSSPAKNQAHNEPGRVGDGACFPPEQDAASIGATAVMQASCAPRLWTEARPAPQAAVM